MPLAGLVGRGELGPLGRPGVARSSEHPRRATADRIDIGVADERRAPIERQGHARAEGAPGVWGSELRSLLTPRVPRPDEHPRGADAVVVAAAADQRRAAVTRERHARTEEPAENALARTGEPWSLLGPAAARAGEHPCRPRTEP